MTWHVTRMGNKKGVHSVLVEKPDGRRPIGRPRRRWEDKIKKDLQEVGWRGTDWIDLAQDRDTWQVLRNSLDNLQVP